MSSKQFEAVLSTISLQMIDAAGMERNILPLVSIADNLENILSNYKEPIAEFDEGNEAYTPILRAMRLVELAKNVENPEQFFKLISDAHNIIMDIISHVEEIHIEVEDESQETD